MPMTTFDKDKLEKLLKTKSMRPARTHHRLDGLTTMVWFVDNDDDRFVELRDSVRSQGSLVLRRDGSRVSAGVVYGVEKAFLLVRHELGVLGGVAQ